MRAFRIRVADVDCLGISNAPCPNSNTSYPQIQDIAGAGGTMACLNSVDAYCRVNIDLVGIGRGSRCVIKCSSIATVNIGIRTAKCAAIDGHGVVGSCSTCDIGSATIYTLRQCTPGNSNAVIGCTSK